MRRFETRHNVHHSAENMFELVADIENYPKFVPLCAQLIVKERSKFDDKEILIADMTAAYKMFKETFTSKVTLKRDQSSIFVEYLDGPFSHLENVWRFEGEGSSKSTIHFFIEYEFRNKLLQITAGAFFDKAFRKFTAAFEERADQVYGRS